MNENALYGKCGGCGHVFIIAHLPMKLGKAARLASRACCPACGAGSKCIVLANADDVASAKRSGEGE